MNNPNNHNNNNINQSQSTNPFLNSNNYQNINNMNNYIPNIQQQSLNIQQQSLNMNNMNNPYINNPYMNNSYMNNSYMNNPYTNHQETNYSDSGNYDDDEPINLKVIDKKENETTTGGVDLKDYVDVNIKLRQRILNINSNATQIVPMLVTLLSKDISGTEKTSIDLVCVIDKSGSMQGRKIQLLKDTFKVLMDLLSDNDRLSIVTFESSSQRITPLLAMNEKGKKETLTSINEIHAGGGTSIASGMNTALEILKQRRMVNNVTGIFLLSDGLDGGAEVSVKNLVEKYDNFPNSSNISINTFGFGDDHDPKLMGSISNLKDGNFYYVDKLETIDQCFGDCLIGLMCVLAEQVTFSIEAVKSHMFPDIKIHKAYGIEGAWKTEGDVYKTSQRYLISGKSRNHLLEISIPPCKLKFDGEKKEVIAKVVVNMSGLKETGYQNLKLEQELCITFVNEDDKISDDYIDFNVMTNYYRVRSAEVTNKARKLADLGENKQAEKELNDLKEEIKKSNFASHQDFVGMMKDLDNTIGHVQPNVYQNQGMKFMIQNAQCNYQEQSNCNNYNPYMNKMQGEFLVNAKKKK